LNAALDKWDPSGEARKRLRTKNSGPKEPAPKEKKRKELKKLTRKCLKIRG